MKNTRNNIKISFGVPTYMIFGSVTKCVMTFEVKMPAMLEKIAELMVDKKYVSPMPRICRGYASMHPKDEYDEKKGLKISMAKAEIAAYTAVHNWLCSIEDCLRHTDCSIEDFLNKTYKVIKHDKKFVGKF